VIRRSVCWIAAGLLLGNALTLVGCRPRPLESEAAPPFVFRELNLRQKDPQGRPLWEITSPETRYDLSRRIAQARNLSGVLYRNGQPLYKLTASTAVVVNDGEVVQLEGPTRLQRLDPKRPAELTALRVRWYPSQQRMELDRSPKLVQGDLQLTAELARFLIDAERLELRRSALLQQKGPQPIRVRLGPLDWQAATGAIKANGPVQGERRLADGAVQRITAPALSGNSLAQSLDLQAPVRLEDPSRQAWVEAGVTRLALASQTASSGAPFRARYGKTQLSGTGFVLDLGRKTMAVRGACQLRQPGEQLRATSCLWNWDTNEATASGQVVLQRKANGQESRADQLEGRIGEDGFAEFSSPMGGRVRTQLTLPPGAARRTPGTGRPPRSPAGPRQPAFQL
jgi:LPS export ABC transporter protein LptC